MLQGRDRQFQSTPPARGATHQSCHRLIWGYISIHAPREGGDFAFAYVVNTDNSISIHAPREGGDDTVVQREEEMKISIHAPREGGDTVNGILKLIRMIISIHAPREGGDSVFGR